jgi:hypothetical protein
MTHYIGKTSIELRLRGIRADAAFQWQQQAERFCYDQLLPALDALFARLAGPDEVLTIDKLDLDLRGLPANQWEETLLRQVLEAVEDLIQKRLNTSFPDERVERRPVALSHFDQWLHFLATGALPPGQAPTAEAVLRQSVLETVAAQSRALQRFLDLIRRDVRALRRLLWQHDDAFLDALLEASAGTEGKRLVALRTEAEMLLKEKPKRGQILDFEKNKSIKPEKLLPVFRQIFQEKTWAALAESKFEPVQVLQQTWVELFAWHIPELSARSAYLAFLQQQIEARPARFAAISTTLAPVVEQLKKDMKTGATPQSSPFEKEKTEPAAALSEPAGDDTASLPEAANLKPETLKPETSKIETSKPEAANVETLKPETLKPEVSDWYVRNAGVVLLHPFLPTLFQTLGLTNKGQFDTMEKRQQAVHLLHYAATGQTDAPEFDLVFEKFLCGWEIETPLRRDWKLEIARPSAQTSHSDGDESVGRGNWEEEVETMLQAAIKNWGKLGNASPDALRENFLRRPGKLSYRPSDGWRLRLESSGIDILLNYLPWGLSVVKLPWMKEMLNVEWTS